MANGDDKDDIRKRILRAQRSKDRPDPVADVAKAAGRAVAKGVTTGVDVVTRPYNPRTQAIIDKLTPSYEGATPAQIAKSVAQISTNTDGAGREEEGSSDGLGPGVNIGPRARYATYSRGIDQSSISKAPDKSFSGEGVGIIGDAIPDDIYRRMTGKSDVTPSATSTALTNVFRGLTQKTKDAAASPQKKNVLGEAVKDFGQRFKKGVVARGEKLLDTLQKTKEKPEPEKDRFTDVRALLKQGVGAGLRRQDFASADSYAQAIRQAAGTEAPLGASSPLRQTPRELGRLSGAMNRAGRRLIRKGAAAQGFAMFGKAEAQRLNEGSAISTPERRAREEEERRQQINLRGATQQRVRDYQNLRNQMGTGVQGAPQGLSRPIGSNIPQAGSPTSNIRQSPMNKRFGL